VREPLIYLITDGAATAENFRKKSVETLKIIEKSVAAKINLIQIREKLLSAKQVFELVSEAVKLTKDSATKLLVNDRADLALAARADGVHLTSASISTEIIRKNFPPDFIIGVSAHNLAEVGKARREGADFATLSPIFATASKARYGAPQGIEKLREAAAAFEKFPVVALGGINEENFAEALRAGAKGIAAIRLLNDIARLAEIVEGIRDYKND